VSWEDVGVMGRCRCHGKMKKHNPKVYEEFQTLNTLETLYIMLGIIF